MGTNDFGLEIFAAPNFQIRISEHASIRMHERCISREQLNTAICFGRVAYVRGATVYAMGKREIAQLRHLGIQSDRLEGIQVVCNQEGDTVVTLYRNRDMSGLRRKTSHYRGRPCHDQYLLAA